MKFCYDMGFPIKNNPKDLDPSYKMDVGFLGCFRRETPPSYKQRNIVNGTVLLTCKRRSHTGHTQMPKHI